MSVFDAYCDDLNAVTNDIRSNLANLKAGGDADAIGKSIQELFDQSKELIEQAEVEARSHASKERRELTEKLRSYKDDVQKLRSEYDGALFQNQKAQLTGQKGEDRGRFLDVNEKIRNQNEMIENAKRTVAESEDIGLETLGELERNREKIESAREKNQEFAAITEDADKRLKSMWFRQKTW
eukprot:CAMPEP_0174969010 /NCGR_PEP_ID=MMETSP0004_2-20121128/8484_1 /TAXON_ID=420556 /ORGANISM="Ochromonas sp., Strain CCMP1393" /LENGTH=181 /DNA_ID=CAMNT_0016218371 /DNA_START=159 /DNA_END=701 /DNA_ORIENTATION=-